MPRRIAFYLGQSAVQGVVGWVIVMGAFEIAWYLTAWQETSKG